MNIILIVIATAGLIGCIWLYKKLPKSTPNIPSRETKSDVNDDFVRRINANEREEYRQKENLYTSKSGNDRRNFYLDIKEDANGKKFMAISEVVKEIGGDRGYTVVIQIHEIEGFKKAFERSYQFLTQ